MGSAVPVRGDLCHPLGSGLRLPPSCSVLLTNPRGTQDYKSVQGPPGAQRPKMGALPAHGNATSGCQEHGPCVGNEATEATPLGCPVEPWALWAGKGHTSVPPRSALTVGEVSICNGHVT